MSWLAEWILFRWSQLWLGENLLIVWSKMYHAKSYLFFCSLPVAPPDSKAWKWKRQMDMEERQGWWSDAVKAFNLFLCRSGGGGGGRKWRKNSCRSSRGRRRERLERVRKTQEKDWEQIQFQTAWWGSPAAVLWRLLKYKFTLYIVTKKYTCILNKNITLTFC